MSKIQKKLWLADQLTEVVVDEKKIVGKVLDIAKQKVNE